MKITITINLPEEELLIKLVKDGVTRKEFVSILAAEFAPLLDAGELCPGGTAQITIL